MVRNFRIGAVAAALALSAVMAPALVKGVSAQSGAPSAGAASVSPEQRSAFEGIIRDYLLKNPAIIREAMQVLQAQEEAAKQAAAAQALKQYRSELLQNARSPVGGNPAGDITVVEFFDYNCGYCKRVAPAVNAVVANDPNVRIVYKEFAILGPNSLVAARAALAAKRQGKCGEFHDALMSAEQADTGTVTATAKALGLDYEKLVRDMEDPEITEQLERNYRLANALGINGTPAFVIGDRLVPGAIDENAMMEIIADERAKMTAAPRGN